MGAVLVIVVGVDGEGRAMAVDGGKGRTAVGVKAEIGITLATAGATAAGAASALEGGGDGVVSSDIRKRISANRAYAYAVYLNICNMIAAVWRDGKDLIRTLSHKNAAAGTDGTAGAGGGADGEGPRVLLPDDGEGEKPALLTSNLMPLALYSTSMVSGSQASMASSTSA